MRFSAQIRSISHCLLAACCLNLTGCGLPTWNQLIGATPATPPQPVVAPVQPVPVVTPVKPPEPPPKPKPEVVIARFKQLQRHEIDDKTLGSLFELESGLDEITELNLQGTQVTSAGLSRIGKLLFLTKLDIRNSNIEKDAIASIGEVPSLVELRLHGKQIDDAGMTALNPLFNLKILEMQGAKLSSSAFSELRNHVQLIDLDLRGSTIDDAAMESIADLPMIERLILGKTRVGDDGVLRLSKLDRLAYLDLGDTRVTGKGFALKATAKGWKSLKSLVIGGAQLDYKGAGAIHQLKALESLDITSLPFLDDRGLSILMNGLTELVELRLANCPRLNSQSMLVLKPLRRLERLDLSACPRIDDAVFNFLLTCKSLKQVNLSGTGCSAVNAEKFRRLMPDCEVIGFPGV